MNVWVAVFIKTGTVRVFDSEYSMFKYIDTRYPGARGDSRYPADNLQRYLWLPVQKQYLSITGATVRGIEVDDVNRILGLEKSK